MDLIILGASGSIGTQSIQLLKNLEKKWTLAGFSIGNKAFFIDQILSDFGNVRAICVKNKKDYIKYKKKYKSVKFFYGNKGLIHLINYLHGAVVLNALVGFVGLKPSLVAIKKKRTLLLANKESLVCGGELINKSLKKGGRLIPIDSEHVGLKKCMYGRTLDEVEELIITASGGPFYNLSLEELKNVTKEDALKHPTWQMGEKITIDSATMMNKTFELIEAHYLFDIPIEKIHAIVNRKSKVHSLIHLKNGNYVLNVGPNDMKIPISYALNYGEPLFDNKFDDVEINTYNNYEFLPLSEERFGFLKFANIVAKNGGDSGTILNAINEVCVRSFLNDEIKFIDIVNIVDKIFKGADFHKAYSYNYLFLINKIYRKKAQKLIKKGKKI